jgi:RNA polymerase sigma-70 factor (ECF subfamily)
VILSPRCGFKGKNQLFPTPDVIDMTREDANLVEDTLGGDTEAYGVLVRRYQRVIFNMAYRMTKDYDEAEDISQVAFIRAYENLGRYDPDHRFYSWIYRIAVNETLNRIKSRKKMTQLNPTMVSPEKSPDVACGESELDGKIQEALMDLDPSYRVLVVMRHFMSCSYKEISDTLSLPEKRVKSRLFSARQMLRSALVARGVVRND